VVGARLTKTEELPTRRTVLRTAALTTTVLALPFARSVRAAGSSIPKDRMVLAWHTNIAARWLDPQQHDGTASPDNFLMALHDALIKNFRETKYDHPALAEQFDFAEDAKSATIRLRAGSKFHDGTPVAPADVRWSYEHYRGAWGDVLKAKTDGVEIVGDDTVRFHFNEPFPDFPILLGTANVCGAGWVVPARYYEKVGADGFMQKPIGAGPYKLVSQQQGIKLEFEAFDGYYRPVHVKQLTMISVPDAVTRVAMLERGEADIIYNVPGELIERIKSNPKLMLAPVLSANFWLEFPGFQDAKNPFRDKRVRQAVSLAIDRNVMNEAECGGLGRVDGNWINDDVAYAIDWPQWPYDPGRAKQLLAEAGHPEGFTVDWITPLPDYFSRGERIVSMLRRIGIRGKLQVMERGVFLKRLQGGLREWPGVQIILNAARVGGTWSNWYDSFMKCGGFNGRDRNCVAELDAAFARYLSATDPSQRQGLAEQIQRQILENYYFVPVFRHAAMQAIGSRVAAPTWQSVFPTMTTAYAYPWEDIALKDGAAANQ
jgi:peptide/nickel transport system substrate-binding protein